MHLRNPGIRRVSVVAIDSETTKHRVHFRSSRPTAHPGAVSFSMHRTVSRYSWYGRPQAEPPNKRLKLPGGDRSKGSGVLCPGGARTSSHTLAPAGGSPAA